MDKYFECKLLPSSEFKPTVLLNAVFPKIHHALRRAGAELVGISFPDYKKKGDGEQKFATLGERIRFHGKQNHLEGVKELILSSRVEDYLKVSEIRAIPAQPRFRTVRRVHIKSSPARLLRRSVRKGWITEEEARRRLNETEGETTDLPFLQVPSSSTGQKFRLFIEQGPVVDSEVEGSFSSYGFSNIATIPWFA